jgi:hypothetical protein
MKFWKDTMKLYHNRRKYKESIQRQKITEKFPGQKKLRVLRKTTWREFPKKWIKMNQNQTQHGKIAKHIQEYIFVLVMVKTLYSRDL